MSLVAKIKQKKELRGLADSFVESSLVALMKKKKYHYPLSKRDEKIVIKELRAQLRNYTGRFQKNDDRIPLSQQGRWSELLQTHASTKERLPYYPVLRELIASVKPRSILDLGCGLNPLALATPAVTYHAIDIQKEEIELLNTFFQQKTIPGEAIVGDIRTIAFPQADLTLVLKVIDLVDKSGHKGAEALLKRIPSRHIIVSFSTKTISGKSMNHPQRGWIERLCTRLGYMYKLTITKNELFYLIEKP